MRKCSKPLAEQPHSTEAPGQGKVSNALPMSGVNRNSGATAPNNCGLNNIVSNRN